MGSDQRSNLEKGKRRPPQPTPTPTPDPGVVEPGEPALVAFELGESTASLTNPERGFYVGYDLVRGSTTSAANIRAAGHALAISIVRLDDYRTSDLPDSLLLALGNGFNAARSAGIKIILRFNYNASFSADASRERILGHITQLTPLLTANADVIAVMQAGFIGAWGEWHSSTNGLDNDTDRTTILNAILAALPASRGVQVRTPMFKHAAFPGGPLTSDEAYAETARARVGHHNDCFLASESDLGTYASPVSYWQEFVAEEGRFTAIGGETCKVYEPKTNCAAAVETMRAGHWSYLNKEYNQLVLAAWASGGCDAEIRDRLGYRFALQRVAHSERVAPGGELAVDLDVANTGFASVYNQRPIEVVLAGGGVRRIVRLASADVRRWAPGDTSKVSARLRVPADLPPGSYTLALRFPDGAESLATDSRYAIQLANDGVWDPATGDNVLTRDLVIDADAPGRKDPSATTFVEL